jgi:hypothetical protein
MTKDWTNIYKKYPGKWVALDARDEVTVIAVNADARKVYAESMKYGKEAILHRVPEEVTIFAGYEVRV